MIGLIVKIFTMFGAVILAVLIVLNVTNVWDPGTISLTAPDQAPCDRYAAATWPNRSPREIDVRWIVTAENYGWGCYFEFGDLVVETVTPMPE